jgi:CRISPR system Cascade subunit CasE
MRDQPLFLSRLRVTPSSRAARKFIADAYQTHRNVCDAFDRLVAGRDRVLWRWEPNRSAESILLVQSTVEPDWCRLNPELLASEPEVKDLRHLRDAFTEGRRLAFALTANPSRKIDTRSAPDGTRRNGRRVPLRREAAQLEWLQRQAVRAGFALPDNQLGTPQVRIGAGVTLTGRRGHQRITVEAVRFDGALVVTDADGFASAIRSGIGPARAFGCGLLTVAPLR